MMEKIILAIAITFSLYLSIEIKPVPRFVGMEIDAHLDSLKEPRTPIFLML
ncbi:MAG: hypothetical protein LH474_07740 [Chamaesiphon sp.]|nr:hypothetical protein [Chamaesiphon sp.]